ncbi:MAG: DUF3106 domain-containing protein [Candidatus Acidiferrales bacterium]
MKHRRLIVAAVIGLAIGAGPAPQRASAQRFPRVPARYWPVAQKETPHARNDFDGESKPNNSGGAVRGQPNLRGLAGLPPRWVENLREMPPEQQERFMQNNRVFQNLPPERQTQIRKNLENWNRLSPDERQEIRQRAQILERMTPQQRQYLRNTLLPRWQEMPQERRQAINGRLRILQTMGPGAQQAALADPKFMQGLSQDEQSMLRDLNSFRNPLPQ